jgi:hypothetical protein
MFVLGFSNVVVERQPDLASPAPYNPASSRATFISLYRLFVTSTGGEAFRSMLQGS